MSKVLVDRELLRDCSAELSDWRMSFPNADSGMTDRLVGEIDAILAQPAEAEGVDFGFDDRSVKVSQEAYSIFLEREQHHLAALSAVTAERDRFREQCRIHDMLHGTKGRERVAALLAENEALRKDAERWNYVRIQGDDTHWLNLLRVDLDDFGGNINAAVDALIDGEAPATAAKEA